MQLSTSCMHHLSFGIAYGMTDTGRVRRSNEDNFLIDEQLGLAMVADGMGGHQAGGTASAEALQSVRRYLAAALPAADEDITIPATLAANLPRTAVNQDMPGCVCVFQALDFANRQLYSRNMAQGHAEGEGTGTTLTGFWQHRPGHIVAFHIGDSRLYRYRSGEMSLLTRDQTVYQRAVDAGQADNLPGRHLLLQAVGPTSSLTPAIHVDQMQSGDVYLLCSDGLHANVPAEEIAEAMATVSTQGIEQCCAKLITLANTLDGYDNVTVVLTLCR